MVETETIFLPIADGLSTATDPRAGATVMAAENMEFQRAGVLSKRKGQEKSTAHTSTNPSRISATGGSVTLWGNGPVSVQAPGQVARAISADQNLSLVVEKQPIWNVERPDDVAAGTGFIAVLAGGEYIRTFDPDSGVMIEQCALKTLPSAGGEPIFSEVARIPGKLVALPNGTVGCYYGNGGIRYRIIAANGVIGAESAAVAAVGEKYASRGGLSSYAWMDACLVGSTVVVFYQSVAGGGALDGDMVAVFLPDGLAAGAVVTVIATGGTYRQVCACYARDTTRVDLVWIEEAGGTCSIVAQSRTASTQAVSIAKGTIYSFPTSRHAGNTAHSLCGIGNHRSPVGNTKCTVYATMAGRDNLALAVLGYDFNPEVFEISAIDSSGTMTGAITNKVFRAMMATKPIALGSGWLFGVISRAWLFSSVAGNVSDTTADEDNPITSQDTFVWMASGASAPIPVGLSSRGEASWSDKSIWTTGLTQWTANGTDLVAVLPTEVSADVSWEQRGYGEVGNVRYVYMSNLYRLRQSAAGAALDADGTCLLPGSLPRYVDGQKLAEQGFIAYPEPLSIAAAAGTGNLTTGLHYWVATFEEVDSKGRLHRSSATGSMLSLDVPPGTNRAEVRVPAPCITLRTGTQIVIWRTLVGQPEIFYRVGSVPVSLYLPLTDAYYTFTDEYSDADIDQNEPLHMSGGLLGPLPPPAYAACAVWDSRHFAVDAEDPKRRICYSKQKEDNVAYEHNPDLCLTIDEQGGDIVALCPCGESLLALKESGGLFTIDGVGLNAMAQGENYNVRPVPGGASVCCKSPRLVAQTPTGVMFDGTDGIYMISPDGGVQVLDQARAIYATSGASFVEAVAQPLRQRVVFLSSSGTALVWNWRHQRFTHFTAHASIAGTDLGGVLYRLDSSLQVWTPIEAYADDGAFISARARIGWISPGGPGARAFVKEVLPVMYKRGGHKLTIRVAYDGAPFFVDATAYTASDLEVFESSAHYGAGAANLAEQAYTLRYQQSRRSLSSLMLELQDSADGSSGNTAGFELLGVALDVAKLPGPSQVDRTRHARS